MTLNNTRVLYGDDMFLSTILLELSDAVNGHYEYYRVYFVIK